MTTTIRLTEKEASQIIADHLAAKGHQVSSIKFVCTDNYPSAKDYEGNWVQAVEATVSDAPDLVEVVPEPSRYEVPGAKEARRKARAILDGTSTSSMLDEY